MKEQRAELPDTMCHHVCEQNADMLLKVSKAGTNRKQKSLGPGDAVRATRWVNSTMRYIGTPVPPREECAHFCVRPALTEVLWWTSTLSLCPCRIKQSAVLLCCLLPPSSDFLKSLADHLPPARDFPGDPRNRDRESVLAVGWE